MVTRQGHIVLVDANVWFSRTLRDWVCLLASDRQSSLFTALWTEDILAETIANIREKFPLATGGQVAHIREQIIEVFPEGQVRDYDSTYPLTDPKDAHVHGAAIAGHADVLLTNNTKDFLPASGTDDDLPYELYTPDDFFLLVDSSSHALVHRTAHLIDEHHSGKGTPYSIPERLRSAGAPEFACIVAKILLGQG